MDEQLSFALFLCAAAIVSWLTLRGTESNGPPLGWIDIWPPVILAGSFLLGMARVEGYKSQAFQAIAHFWICGILVSGAYCKGWRRWFQWAIVFLLSVVEMLCFTGVI